MVNNNTGIKICTKCHKVLNAPITQDDLAVILAKLEAIEKAIAHSTES
jgi:hypothetical protein